MYTPKIFINVTCIISGDVFRAERKPWTTCDLHVHELNYSSHVKPTVEHVFTWHVRLNGCVFRWTNLMFELAHSGSHSCVSGYHCHGEVHCTYLQGRQEKIIAQNVAHWRAWRCVLAAWAWDYTGLSSLPCCIYFTKYYCVPFFKINK